MFVSGYALNLTGHKKSGYTLIILSGLIGFPYIIFSILFFVFLSIEEIKDKRSFRINRYIYIGLAVSIGILAMEYLLFMYEAAINHSSLQESLHIVSGSIIANLGPSIDLKIYAVLLLLFPFLCLPLLSKKWTIFILVYILLLFISGNGNYFFPNFVRLQYLGIIVPFLYIGTLEVLANLGNIPSKTDVEKIKKRRPINPSFKFKLKVAITVFILIVLLGTTFEPYGPLNKYSSTDFEMNE